MQPFLIRVKPTLKLKYPSNQTCFSIAFEDVNCKLFVQAEFSTCI